MLHLGHIRSALGRHSPEIVPAEDDRRRASVAIALAGAEDDLRLCFIRRTEREGDPWSGHMALPGGRVDAGETPRQAAERETFEEVGLTVGDGCYLGTLSDLPVLFAGRRINLVLSSFVYDVGREIPPLVPEPEEVAAAYWISLRHLWTVDECTHLELERDGRTMIYPAVRFRDTVIWGLTFRILSLFSDVLDHPLPHLEEIPGLYTDRGR